MASVLANKPHRRNRRKLGRGQTSAIQSVTATVTSTGTTNATVTYSRPVVVRGAPALAVATRTQVSHTQTSPTTVSVTMSGNVTTLAYTLTANDPNVTPSQGGQTGGTSGTFS